MLSHYFKSMIQMSKCTVFQRKCFVFQGQHFVTKLMKDKTKRYFALGNLIFSSRKYVKKHHWLKNKNKNKTVGRNISTYSESVVKIDFYFNHISQFSSLLPIWCKTFAKSLHMNSYSDIKWQRIEITEKIILGVMLPGNFSNLLWDNANLSKLGLGSCAPN